MAAMYDGDNNRVFQIDNTYKWEDCYGKEVLIPESQRTEDGDSPKEQLASVVKGGANAKGYTLTEYVNDINRENVERSWSTAQMRRCARHMFTEKNGLALIKPEKTVIIYITDREV